MPPPKVLRHDLRAVDRSENPPRTPAQNYPVPPGCDLTHPVGAIQGYNLPKDVELVQRLLNGVPPAKGGPAKALTENGVCDQQTIQAIYTFAKARAWFTAIIYPNSLLHLDLCFLSDNTPLFPSPYVP